MSQNDIADVEYQFLSEQDVKDVDVLYFRELLSGVATNSAYLDGLMKPYLSRLLEELVMQCLKKAPGERPDVVEFIRTLQEDWIQDLARDRWR